MKFNLKPAFLDSNDSFERFKEIISTFHKYGLSDWLSDSKVSWLASIISNKALDESIQSLSVEKRIRLAIMDLGPAFIKMGQILSTRDDLISQELVSELRQLQNNVDADSFDYVSKTLLDELQLENINDAFSTFSEHPIASASIGQVHRATLHSGEKVVVKIMHNNIEEIIHKDLKILTYLAKLAERYGKFANSYRPLKTVQSFESTLLNELDFRIELKNLNQFRHNFEHDENIIFPKPFAELSSKKVLTMERLDGTKIDQLDVDQEIDANPKEIADLGAQMFMDMIFRDNLYHADPHPGNIFYIPTNSLGVIDCGMTGSLDERTRRNLELIISGIAEEDFDKVTDAILEMTSSSENTDVAKAKKELRNFIEDYVHVSFDALDMTKIAQDALSIIRSHGLSLPSNLVLLIRAIVMLEGTSRSLHPEFNLLHVFQTYYKNVLLDSLTPELLFKRLFRNARRWDQIIELAPQALNRGLAQSINGKPLVSIKHDNIDGAAKNIGKGVFFAALILSFAIITASSVGPAIEGISILGILGMVISIYFAYKSLFIDN